MLPRKHRHTHSLHLRRAGTASPREPRAANTETLTRGVGAHDIHTVTEAVFERRCRTRPPLTSSFIFAKLPPWNSRRYCHTCRSSSQYSSWLQSSCNAPEQAWEALLGLTTSAPVSTRAGVLKRPFSALPLSLPLFLPLRPWFIF